MANQRAATAPPGAAHMASWFVTEVRALVERKRDLLPTVTTFIDDARLEAIDDATDRLVVTTAAGNEALLALSARSYGYTVVRATVVSPA